MNGRWNPSWVKTELASMTPGSVSRSLYSWNSMLSVCVKSHQAGNALELYNHMQAEGIVPDAFTFARVLNACSSLAALEEGKRIHAHVIQCGCESNVFVGSNLMDMYVKCGNIEDARRVFQSMPTRDVVCWNTMLTGYVRCQEGQKTVELFQQMQAQGVKPDTVSFVAVLNACASYQALETGRCVHERLIQCGWETDLAVGNSLVNMYGKCGSIGDAQIVFDKMPFRDIVSWSTMLGAYAKCEGQKALELFKGMQDEGVKADAVTFVVLLNACANIMRVDEGRRIHTLIIQNGCESDVFVGSTLVDMYAKCGCMEDAENVFHAMPKRDVVAWNAMLAGYVKCEEGEKAVNLFQQMSADTVKANPTTFVMALNACAKVMALEEGRGVHVQIIESDYEVDVVLGNSLLDMYAKCGSIEDAERVFHTMPTCNVVSWSTMLAGYVKCDKSHKALELFSQMLAAGVKPNPVSFVGVLNACAKTMALEEGIRAHGQVIQNGFESDVVVGNSLVDMYCKCGSLQDAQRVFQALPTRNVVSWSSMLGGFAIHGCGKEALQLFHDMHKSGVEMNTVTFVNLLSACSHAGLIEEGIRFFKSMGSVYPVSRTVEHFVCMVDILGRAGRLDDAENLIKGEPTICKDIVALMSLLGACRNHLNVEMAERIAQQVLELEPDNSAVYVLLSNIYAANGKWGSCAKVKEMQKIKGIKKEPGCTWIEVDTQVHSFVVDDQTHPQIDAIHEELQKLYGQMTKAGYVPDTHFVGYDVGDEEKISHLSRHSEKLAIAFGLINTAPGTPLRIYKNLRVCVDCHTASKFIAKISGRELIVRDANRFHHFKNGLCSCRDYW